MFHRQSRKVVGIVCLLGLVALMAAPVFGAKVELRFLTWAVEPSFTRHIEFANDYMKKHHPDVVVTGSSTANLSGGYMQHLTTAFVAGSGPDLYFFGRANFSPEWIDTGSMMPLTNLLKAEPALLADIHPAILDSWRYEGNIYVVPATMATYATYYNKEQFSIAGLAKPSPDWTMFGEFKSILPKLTRDLNGDGKTDQWAYQLQTALSTRFMNQIMSNGANLVDNLVTRARTAEPQFIEVLQFFKDLLQSGYAIEASSYADFATGKQAMFDSGVFHMPLIASTAKVDWGVVHMPQGRGGRQHVANFNGWAINPKSPNVELAWELAKAFGSPEFGRFAFANGLEFPASMTAARADFLKTLPANLSQQEGMIFIEALDFLKPFPVNGLIPSILTRAQVVVRDALRNPQTAPRVAAEQLAEEINVMIRTAKTQ